MNTPGVAYPWRSGVMARPFRSPPHRSQFSPKQQRHIALSPRAASLELLTDPDRVKRLWTTPTQRADRLKGQHFAPFGYFPRGARKILDALLKKPPDAGNPQWGGVRKPLPDVPRRC